LFPSSASGNSWKNLRELKLPVAEALKVTFFHFENSYLVPFEWLRELVEEPQGTKITGG